MWKNMNSIIDDRLFLGNIQAARSTRSLAEHRITHILSVCKDQIPGELPESGMHHMRIPVEDVDYEDLLIHFPSACRFVEEALQVGGTVLVHSVEGISRSAAVVAAYLMWRRRIHATEALGLVRSARENIWPNAGFQEQLVLFELCRYAPSPANGYYASWRVKLDHQLQEAAHDEYPSS